MKKPERPKKFTEDAFQFLGTEYLNSIKEIDRDYPYWEKVKYRIRDYPELSNESPEFIWHQIKLFRRYRLLNINNGHSFKYSNTNFIERQLHLFDLQLGGMVASTKDIGEHSRQEYIRSSFMEEAIASSQLEGAVTTRVVAKEMLRSKRKPRTESEQMILNNYATIEFVREATDRKLTPDLIREIHKIVSAKTLKNETDEGQFRSNNEVKVVDELTGEVFYEPPNHEEIEDLIQDVCSFMNDQDSDPFVHPILKGIMLHFFIGYIHPFVDGNGRTARALFYWYLIKQGYWIVEYLSISRIILKAPSKYARAYLHTEYDDNDLTYFLIYNLECMTKALDEFNKYVNRKVAGKREFLDLIKSGKINERQAQILREFKEEPSKTMSIKEVESRFGVVYQTARTDLLDLVGKGFLNQTSSGKKMLFFKD